MGRFFIFILLLVAALTAMPGVYLWLTRETQAYDGRVVYYAGYISKVPTFESSEIGSFSDISMASNMYEPLYHYHYLKRPLELEPILAAAMPAISDNACVYTIPIRQDVQYAPNACFGVDEAGRPRTRTITADDFVMTFKRVADFHVRSILAWPLLGTRVKGIEEYHQKTVDYLEGDFRRYDDLNIEGVKALDEHTLQITLNEPFPQFLYVIAGHYFAPTPREAIDYYLTTEGGGQGARREIPVTRRNIRRTKAEQFVGTGPYVMTEWEQASRIVFERNPLYRHGFYPTEGEPGDAEEGLLDDAGKSVPFIDVIIYDFIPQDTTAWQMFLSGKLQSTGIPKEVFDQVITPGKDLEEQWAKRHIVLRKYTRPSLEWFGFNMTDPIVGKSKSLRQGLSLAFDTETMINVLYNGRGKPAVNIVPSIFPAHQMAEPCPYARYDLDAAREKLAQAKIELGKLGLLNQNGEIPELTLDLPSTEEYSRRLGEFVQQQFAEVGVRLKVNPQDWPTFAKRIRNREMQISQQGWNADYPDGENFLQLFYTPNIDAGSNDTFYSNPEYDALYNEIKNEMDHQTRYRKYVQMMNILNQDCPYIFREEPFFFTLRYEWVKNSKPHPVGFGYMKYLRLDLERRDKLRSK